MHAREYERKYDETPPEPVDETITMGTTPEPDFDSSPDVAVDGSVDRGTEPGDEREDAVEQAGFLTRLRNWLF